MRKRAKKTMLAYFVSASLFPVMAMDLSDDRPDKEKQPKVTGEHTAKTDFLQKVYEHRKFQEPNPNKNFQIFRTNVNSWMQENAKHPAFHEDLTSNLEMSLRRLTQNYYHLDHQNANDDTVNPLKFMGIFSSYWKQADKTGHLKNLPIDLIASSMQFADRMLLDNLKFYSEKCQGNVCAFSRETGLIDPESNDDLKNSQSYQAFYRDAHHNFEMLRLDTAISLMNHPRENRLAHSISQNLDRDTLISNSLPQKPEQNHLSLSSVLNLDEKENPLQEVKGVKFLDRAFFDVIEELPIQEQIQTLFAQIESLSNSFSGQEGAYLKLRGEIQSAIHDLDEKFRSKLPAQMIRSSSFRTAGMKVPDDLKLMAILSEYVNKIDEIHGISGNKTNEILKKDPDVSNCYFNFEIKPGEYASGFTYQFGLRNPEMYPELKQSQDYMDLYASTSQHLAPLLNTAKSQIQKSKITTTSSQSEPSKEEHTPQSHKQPEPLVSLTSSSNSDDNTGKKEFSSSLSLTSLQESSTPDDPTKEARHNPIFLNQVDEKLEKDGINEALLQLANNIGSWVNNPDSQMDFYQNLMNNISYSISKLYYSYFSKRIENNKVSDYLKLIAGLRDYATKINNRIPPQFRTANIPDDVIKSTNHLLWRGANFEENWGNGPTISNPYFRFNNTIAFSSVEGLIDPDSNTKLGESENYRTFYQLVNQQFHPLEMTAWKNIIMEWLNAPEQKRMREAFDNQQPMGDTPHPQLVVQEVVDQPIHNNQQPELVVEPIVEQKPIQEEAINQQPEPIVEQVVEQQPIREADINQQPEPIVEQVIDQQPIQEDANQQPELVAERIVEQQPIQEDVINQQPEPIVEQVVDQQPIRKEAINQQPEPIVEQVVDQQPIREEAINQHIDNLNAAHNMIHLVHDIDDVDPEHRSAAFPQGTAEKVVPAIPNSSPANSPIFMSSSGGKLPDTNKASLEKSQKTGVFQALFSKFPDNPPLGVGGLGLRKIFMQQTKDLKAQENSKKNPGKTPNKGDANNLAPVNAFDCSSKEGLERAKVALKDKGVQSIALRQVKKDDLNDLWPHMNQLVKLDIEFHKAEDVLGRKPLPNLKQLSFSVKDNPSLATIHSVVALFPNLSSLVVDHKQGSSPSVKIDMAKDIAKKRPNLISVSVV